MYLWPNLDFQQVRQVKTKPSDKEVDMLTDLEEDVSACLHWAGFIWRSIFFPQIKGFSHPKMFTRVETS